MRLGTCGDIAMRRTILPLLCVGALAAALAGQGGPPTRAKAPVKPKQPTTTARTRPARVGAATEEVVLLPVKRGRQWGYMNADGELVIKPKYKYAFPFSEGRGAVYLHEYKCGYVDETGKLAVAAKFVAGASFSEGLACVNFLPDKKKGYVDAKYGYVDVGGRVAMKPQFTMAGSFSESLAAVRVGGKWSGRKIVGGKCGFVDATGKMVLQAVYEDAHSFSEGLAAVKAAGKWRYIDTTGATVISGSFRDAGEFHEGLAAVKIREAGAGRWAYVTRQGKVVFVRKEFWSAGPFSEGLARVRVNKRTGYINKTGKAVIPLRYAGGRDFHEGLAAVKIGGRYGYIDPTGHVVIKPDFDDARDFSNGLAMVRFGGDFYDDFRSKRGILVGYIDRKGTYVWEPQE